MFGVFDLIFSVRESTVVVILVWRFQAGWIGGSETEGWWWYQLTPDKGYTLKAFN